MNKKWTAVTIIGIVSIFYSLLIVNPAWAADQNKRLNDEAELSYVSTGGNTDVVTMSAKNLLKYGFTERLLGTWKLAALTSETDKIVTARTYFTEARLDYGFSERAYGYTNIGWLKDKFSGVDPRTYIGLGGGYKFLTGPKQILLGELGLVSVNEEYIDDTDDSFIDGRAFAEYNYIFHEKSKFLQSIEYLADVDESDNYRVNSETALTSTLNSVMSLKVSYVRRFDNQPTPNTLRDTDTIFAVALVVNL